MLLNYNELYFVGIEFSFLSGIYSNSIGFTLEFENSKRLVGLSGIFIGIGEIFGLFLFKQFLLIQNLKILHFHLGGALFGILGSKTNRFGRDPVILLGFITQAVGFFIIFLNIPDSANFGDTTDSAFISSR